MKPSWVLSSDERERRFRKNRDKKEKKEAGCSAGVSPPPQSPGHAVVLPNLPHHLVTVKTDLFPVSTTANSSVSSSPQFATIQMIPSNGGLRLETPRPQLQLPHTGVIVRQYSRFPSPVHQSLPPVDLRVKLEAHSPLAEVGLHPIEQLRGGQVHKMEGSPLPSPPLLAPFVSEAACNFNQR